DADPATTGCGASSYTTPTHPVSVLAGLKSRVGESINVVMVPSGFDRLFDDFVQNSTFIESLTAAFYTNRDLEGDPKATQTVEHINFNWSETPPPDMPRENYSARFSGKIDVKEA